MAAWQFSPRLGVSFNAAHALLVKAASTEAMADEVVRGRQWHAVCAAVAELLEVCWQ
jgi:hypothetical protein